MCRRKGHKIINNKMKNSKSPLYFIWRRINKKWRIFLQAILILLKPARSTLSIIIVKVIAHLFVKKFKSNSHPEERNNIKINKTLRKRPQKSSVKKSPLQIKAKM